MSPPAVLGELVDRFGDHREAYRSGEYKEAQLREDFLNPFFEALGYCFPAGGGVRSFFVEAKKPSVDIREAIHLGKLHKFVASKKVKKGSTEVDTVFVDEIESWRGLRVGKHRNHPN